MGEKKKKGLRLMGKIFVAVFIPFLVIVLVSCLIGIKGMSDVSETLMKEHLQSASYSLEQTMNSLANGDYRMEDGKLYKGSVDIVANQKVLEEFKENTGMEVSIILDDVRRATTLLDDTGASMIGKPISESVHNRLLNGEIVFDEIEIGSDRYFVHYMPMESKAGEIYGGLFVGYNRNLVLEHIKSSVIKMIAGIFAVAVIAMAIIVVLIGSIGKLLYQTVDHLDEVANGSLNISLHEKVMNRSDEIGALSRSLQKLVDAFLSIVKNIMKTSQDLDQFTSNFRDSFQAIRSSIENVNIAVEEVAHGATQQAEDTQKANEEVIMMGEAIDATAGNVSSLSDSAQTMGGYNQSANEILNELLVISERTNQSVSEVKRQTDDTNHSAQEIQEVIELIASIANQTNLLSLNASIEAARAGEHGRGFAVVATEIRTLADQCKESADKISNIVNALIGNSNRSVHMMDEVAETIGEQNDKLEKTLAMFGELNQEILAVENDVGTIASQVADLGQLKQEVLALLEGLAAVAQENAASTQETSASMAELGDIVEVCTENTNGLVRLSEELRGNTTKFSVEAIKENIGSLEA